MGIKIIPCSAERAGPGHVPWCMGWDSNSVPVPVPIPVPIQPCRTAGRREAPPGPVHFIAFILTPLCHGQEGPSRDEVPAAGASVQTPCPPPSCPLPLNTVFKTFNIKVSSLFSILRNISSVYGALAVNKAPQAPSPRHPGAGVPGCGAGRGAEEVALCSPGGWRGHPSRTPPAALLSFGSKSPGMGMARMPAGSSSRR